MTTLGLLEDLIRQLEKKSGDSSQLQLFAFYLSTNRMMLGDLADFIKRFLRTNQESLKALNVFEQAYQTQFRRGYTQAKEEITQKYKRSMQVCERWLSCVDFDLVGGPSNADIEAMFDGQPLPSETLDLLHTGIQHEMSRRNLHPVIRQTIEAMGEMIDLIASHREGAYEFDSFSAQPLEAALTDLKKLVGE